VSPERGDGSPSQPRHALGRRGEQLAAEHLRRSGLRVIARNVHSARGEIDLIAFEAATGAAASALVFVEVKTRRLHGPSARPREDQLPLAGLGSGQRARLRRLAAAWLADRSRARPSAATIRFDAVGVLLDARGRLLWIEHIRGAW
jgi:putative endonuclease